MDLSNHCTKRSHLQPKCTPKMPSPCLHPCAIFAPMWHAFKIQPKLHNSADHGIAKFFYLCLRLVVYFYSWPPIWPWTWGHTYHHLECVECYCFFNGNFKVSSDPFISIAAAPRIKTSRASSFEGAPFISRSGVDHPVWLVQAIQIFEIIVWILLEHLLVAIHWKRSFVSLLIIINKYVCT